MSDETPLLHPVDLRCPCLLLRVLSPTSVAAGRFLRALATVAVLSTACHAPAPKAPIELDSDHDGVGDESDLCPTEKETINGIDDDDGCPDAGDPRVVLEDGRLTVLDTIRFETGSAVLPPESLALLDQVALTMKANPEIGRMRVEGHTDDTGTREFNMRLSQDRAIAVRDYLIQRGVAETRLVAASYGSERPVESGTDEAARARNRRVEFVLAE